MELVAPEKIDDLLKRGRRIIVGILVLVTLLLLTYLTYSIMSLKEDPRVVIESQRRIDNISISFDKKFLQDLNERISSVKVSEPGGKNPFISF